MQPLCRIDQIPDGGARGFDLNGPDGPVELIVLRQGGSVSGFVNACPHQGTPLNISEDQFLTRDGRFLLCRTHGARFRPDDGFCVAGPCRGRRLDAVPLVVVDGEVLTRGG